ncbi:LCP family protein [Enterococcus faecium]|uniref:LCP family glycopolymer transferase n=1 Tax=Enterococcus faecium TaxID=1352 RepID=UPI000BF189B1|nr:LCP family protein [Enterococcus faecium]PEH49524.1 transcriptional regulator [Enterococcus faecium]
MNRQRKTYIGKKKNFFLWILGVILLLISGIIVYTAKVYIDVKSTADKTYSTVERITDSKRKKKVDYEASEPFSVLLLGIDTGDFGRSEQGRSDSMIVATVNPMRKTTTLVSIPRDTYTEIVKKNKGDKINHAYAYGGVAMSIATVEKFLDIPIDHYAEINMKGMRELIDNVGGVEVNNKFSFNYGGTYFSIGKLKLNGNDALKYTRMRYEDPKGDYGRQDRQRQVISGVIDRIKSIHTLTNYTNLLDVIGSNAHTDISWNVFQSLIKNYRSALSNVNTDQLTGQGFTGDGVDGEKGISYQRVTSEELQRVQIELKEQLK